METGEKHPAKPRSRRIYTYWSIALILLLGLGLFCWLFVVPVWQVTTVIEERRFWEPIAPDSNLISDAVRRRAASECEQAIAELGGRRAATKKLHLWMRMPAWTLGGEDIKTVRSIKVLYLLAKCENQS